MEWIRSLMLIWNSNKPILLLSHASRRLVSNLRSRQYFLPTFYKLKYKLLASKKSVELINARLNDFRSNKFERQSYKIDRNWRFCIGEKITKSKSIVRRNFLPPKFLQKGVFESDRPDRKWKLQPFQPRDSQQFSTTRCNQLSTYANLPLDGASLEFADRRRENRDRSYDNVAPIAFHGHFFSSIIREISRIPCLFVCISRRAWREAERDVLTESFEKVLRDAKWRNIYIYI